MTKIKYLLGNAVEPIDDGSKSRIITHICNDVGGWGAGFVLALSSKWPNPEREYREWYKRRTWKQRPFVLGQIQTIWVEGNIFVTNMIAQRSVGKLMHEGLPVGVPNVNYSSLREALNRLRIETSKEISIHMPRIGSGLGGGNWEGIIAPLIDVVFQHAAAPVYVYDLEPVEGTTYDNA